MSHARILLPLAEHRYVLGHMVDKEMAENHAQEILVLEHCSFGASARCSASTMLHGSTRMGAVVLRRRNNRPEGGLSVVLDR